MSPSNDIVLRGEDAARAMRIDLVAPSVSTGSANPSLNPTGPWAADIHSAFSDARREGHAVGHQQGWEVGLTQGLAEAREQTAQLEATMEELYRKVERELESATGRLAREATGLALAIAEAILGREVVCAADPGAEAIARCVEMVPLTGAVVAHLNPEDLQRLGRVASLENRELTLVADATLGRGDAVVTVDETMIDGRLAEALDRVVQLLS